MGDRFNGKVAVITGSGRGIGRAAAGLLASEGAKVVINDVDEAPAAEAAAEIRSSGGQAASCVADIRKPEEAQRLMDFAVETYGSLDIVINNAGLTRDAMIHKISDEQWDLVMDINLRGAFNCTRAAARHMMREGCNGRIVYVSSVSGLMGNVGQINYASAKAGLVGMTKSVAKEWARFGITVNCVAYGMVDTRLAQEKEGSEDVMGEKVGIPKKIRDKFLQDAGGKLISVEEAAKPVVFLVSEDASAITGNIINISRGWYM
jgi:3-oxoacyl-[acyl-carrier protein] reductase